MICSNTAALNEHEHRQATSPVRNVAFLASELCYGEDIGATLNGKRLTFMDVQDELINRDGFMGALLACHRNDPQPMQELLIDCAKDLIELASFGDE